MKNTKKLNKKSIKNQKIINFGEKRKVVTESEIGSEKQIEKQGTRELRSSKVINQVDEDKQYMNRKSSENEKQLIKR